MSTENLTSTIFIFTSLLPVTLFCDWAIHNLSITMACWVVLSGYSLSIKFKSESGISRHWASGIQSRPSRLQISDNRKSAYTRLKGKRAALFGWSIVNPTQCALIIYFVNGFGPISGVDESNIVKEAVLLLQSKQVRLWTGCFGCHCAGQNNIQVADWRLWWLTSSGLSFIEKVSLKKVTIITNRFRIRRPSESEKRYLIIIKIPWLLAWRQYAQWGRRDYPWLGRWKAVYSRGKLGRSRPVARQTWWWAPNCRRIQDIETWSPRLRHLGSWPLRRSALAVLASSLPCRLSYRKPWVGPLAVRAAWRRRRI